MRFFVRAFCLGVFNTNLSTAHFTGRIPPTPNRRSQQQRYSEFAYTQYAPTKRVKVIAVLDAADNLVYGEFRNMSQSVNFSTKRESCRTMANRISFSFFFLPSICIPISRN